MRTIQRISATAFALLALNALANGKVEVAFTNPEKFTDIKSDYLDDGSHRADTLKLLVREFADSVTPFVKDGFRLDLAFTDIDLAGDYRMGPQVGATRVRLVNRSYPPRLAFDFTLTDPSGKVVAKGHRDITDNSFLETTRTSDRDPFKYEKQIMRRWAQAELK